MNIDDKSLSIDDIKRKRDRAIANLIREKESKLRQQYNIKSIMIFIIIMSIGIVSNDTAIIILSGAVISFAFWRYAIKRLDNDLYVCWLSDEIKLIQNLYAQQIEAMGGDLNAPYEEDPNDKIYFHYY